MSQEKEKLIAELVNKGLDGDMDSVNACEDRVTRSKVKAMIMKIKKGSLDRPQMPVSLSDTPNESDDTGKTDDKTTEDISQKIKNMLLDNFPDETDETGQDGHMYVRPDKWLDIATWLKSESSLLFDSLQCQMGIDVGEDILESRYNLHSMVHDHYLEVRIRVARSNAKIPSVEQVWRIADWFERETYDMLGIEYVGHRDLRRILLPDDWEGWPLRKDYKEQETYHGIVVPKMKEGWD